MSQKRLVFVIPTLDRSGAEKQLTLLATHLPAEEFAIEVIALNRGGPYEQTLRSAGIPVHILHKRFRIDPLAHWKLQRLLHRLRPDVVHSWLFSANTHVRLIPNRQRHWKTIISERCVDQWKAGWQLALDRYLSQRMEAFVANSASVAEFYQQFPIPPERTYIIPNGLELPPLEDRTSPGYLASRKRWLAQWGFPEDAFVIGFTGRLAKQKKLETLLWAAHMLMLSEPQTRFLFVGDGPEAGALRDLAQKYDVQHHVRFVGHRRDAASFPQYGDAFWLASEFEGQSNSLLEAMAAGLPVVASDIPPNRELITPRENGLLAPVNDAAAFALQMRLIIQRPEWSHALGQQARQTVLTQHSINGMVQAYRRLYHHLLESTAVDSPALRLQPNSCGTDPQQNVSAKSVSETSLP